MGAISPVSGPEDSEEGAITALQKNRAPRTGGEERREGGSSAGEAPGATWGSETGRRRRARGGGQGVLRFQGVADISSL